MPALNHNEGKHRPSLVVRDLPNFFEQLIAVREHGCLKYDRLNWAESIGTDDAERFLDENLDSIFRHLMAYMNGETIDPETGCYHMAHVGVRCGFAVEYAASEPAEGQGVSGSKVAPALDESSTLSSRPNQIHIPLRWS